MQEREREREEKKKSNEKREKCVLYCFDSGHEHSDPCASKSAVQFTERSATNEYALGALFSCRFCVDFVVSICASSLDYIVWGGEEEDQCVYNR